MVAASIVVRIKPPTKESMEMMSCQTGTFPEGIRAIITIGEEKGIMLAQTAKVESGFPAAAVMIMKDKTIGIVIGIINACASCGSSFTTLPTAAKSAA